MDGFTSPFNMMKSESFFYLWKFGWFCCTFWFYHNTNVFGIQDVEGDQTIGWNETSDCINVRCGSKRRLLHGNGCKHHCCWKLDINWLNWSCHRWSHLCTTISFTLPIAWLLLLLQQDSPWQNYMKRLASTRKLYLEENTLSFWGLRKDLLSKSPHSIYHIECTRLVFAVVKFDPWDSSVRTCRFLKFTTK